jgi:hypothetical protein
VSKLRKRIAALLASLVIVGVGVFAIQSPAFAGYYVSGGSIFGPYSIRVADGYGGAKCLDVSNNSPWNGALMQTWDCLGPYAGNQQFYFWKLDGGAGYYQITPSSTWKCLDVKDVSHADYAPLQQYDCLGYGQENQVFNVWFDSSLNAWHIVPIHSWRHMSVTSPTPGNGSSVYQYNAVRVWSLYVD